MVLVATMGAEDELQNVKREGGGVKWRKKVHNPHVHYRQTDNLNFPVEKKKKKQQQSKDLRALASKARCV